MLYMCLKKRLPTRHKKVSAPKLFLPKTRLLVNEFQEIVCADSISETHPYTCLSLDEKARPCFDCSKKQVCMKGKIIESNSRSAYLCKWGLDYNNTRRINSESSLIAICTIAFCQTKKGILIGKVRIL